MEKDKTGYASIDKPWKKYYPKYDENFKIPNYTIYQLLEDSAKYRMNKTALIYFNIKISYKKYLERINETAKALKKLGIERGQIVLLMLPNVPESRILIYALNLIGAISYPINPMIAPSVLEKIIKENDVQNLFIFDGFNKKYKDVIEKSNIKNIITTNGKESFPVVLRKLDSLKKTFYKSDNETTVLDGSIEWNKFIKMSVGEKNIQAQYVPNTIACIIGTSGTTGIPKGVCLTNENMNAMALQHLHGDMNFEEGDKVLDLLIQSIGYGLSVAHYSGVCGLESVLIPTLATDIKTYIDKYHFDHFTGGPIHYETLLKKYGTNIPRAKNMVSGGASLDINVEKKLNSIDSGECINEDLVFVRQGLGCTENGGAATYAKLGTYKLGGVGIPLIYENMGIFKPGTDEELKYGEIGEICISGPTVMQKYLNNPEETSKVLRKHSDGKIWLHTCDLGKVDSDGQFYISDRIKNIFMRKGFNVHPSEVNKFISSLDFVDSCTVIGVSHPTEQMVPVAFIKLNDGVDIENAKNQILNACYNNLDEPSVPYDIIFVDNMPRNIGGKIDNNYLLQVSRLNYYDSSNYDYSNSIKVPGLSLK